MKVKLVLFLLTLLTAVCTGCAEKQPVEKPKYTFTGKTVSLVKQNNYSIDGVRIRYTLQVENFNPTDEAFKKYNEMFGEHGEYKHFGITKNTKIYDSNNQPIGPEDIKMNQEISFSVEFINDQALHALEIREL